MPQQKKPKRMFVMIEIVSALLPRFFRRAAVAAAKFPATPSLTCVCPFCVYNHVVIGRESLGSPTKPMFAAFALERVCPTGPEKHAVVVLDDLTFHGVVLPALQNAWAARAVRLTAGDLVVANDGRA